MDSSSSRTLRMASASFVAFLMGAALVHGEKSAPDTHLTTEVSALRVQPTLTPPVALPSTLETGDYFTSIGLGPKGSGTAATSQLPPPLAPVDFPDQPTTVVVATPVPVGTPDAGIPLEQPEEDPAREAFLRQPAQTPTASPTPAPSGPLVPIGTAPAVSAPALPLAPPQVVAQVEGDDPSRWHQVATAAPARSGIDLLAGTPIDPRIPVGQVTDVQPVDLSKRQTKPSPAPSLASDPPVGWPVYATTGGQVTPPANAPTQVPMFGEFGETSDIDWSKTVRIGDLVPTERDELYRQPVVKIDYPEYSAVKLIKEMAAKAGIEYMMGKVEDQTIAAAFTRAPFAILEEVVDNLGMGLIRTKSGSYLITSVDKTTLVPRSYRFKHIHLDREFSFRDDSDKSENEMPQMQSRGGLGGFGDSSSGSYEKVTSRANTRSPRSASDRARTNFIMERIKQYLDGNAPGNEVTGAASATAGAALAQRPTDDNKGPEPIYDADSNTVFVVTTEQRWRWIEEFLTGIDQETYNVWIQLRFVTTSKGNGENKGINWGGGNKSGLGNGIRFTAEDQGATTTGGSTTTGSIGLGTLSGITKPTAILSASALEAKLRFYETNGNSRMSRVASFIADNNREVVFNLTQNRPVATSMSTTNNTNAGAIVSAGTNIMNEEVGVVVRVLAQHINNGSMRVHTKADITNIVGSMMLGTSEYPIIQKSAVNSSPKLQAGYTVELGGLEQMITNQTREKIPLLGDIPILGLPFRDIVKNADAMSLNLLVTVRLLNDAGDEVVFDEAGNKRVIPLDGPRIKTVDELIEESAALERTADEAAATKKGKTAKK